jgi:predicted NBD/HSP70 family sugar kinase
MIVGIDVSRTRLAVAVLDSDENICMTYLWMLPTTEDERERMSVLNEALRSVSTTTYDGGGAIMGVFIEAAYAGPNIKTSMQQAQWVGVTQALCWRLWPHALSETIGNSEWRKKAGVVMQPGLPYSRPKRQDIKDATRAWAVSRWGDEVRDLSEDEVDALGVAVAGWGIVE